MADTGQHKTGQWQLSAEAAERYQRYVARYILGPWAPPLVDTARIGAGERVLDVACGTGVGARTAMQRVGSTGRVVGVDLNPGMIAVARSLPVSGDCPVEWIEGSALDLPVADAGMDVVLCQQGLQFFPDKALAMREMRRVLVRGGRLALSIWTDVGPYNAAVGEALARCLGDATAIAFCASRAVLAKDQLERLATEAGFTAVDVSVRRMSIRLPRLDQFTLDHLSATPIASRVAAADPGTRSDIGASVMKALDRYADGDGVTYPEAIHLLTARVP
jgi:SAM-dependent methyltransferase